MKMKPSLQRSAALVFSLVLCIQMLFGTSFHAHAQSEDADAAFQITNLKTNQTENPIGFDMETPVFSWQMESADRSQTQAKYQIVVRDDQNQIVWNSGETVSGISVNIPYGGSEIQPKTIYTWNVKVWNQDGVSVTSPSATFETGFMSTSDTAWDASWIGMEGSGSAEPFDFEITVNQAILENSSGLLFKTAEDEEYMWQLSVGESDVQFKPHKNLALIEQSDLTARGVLTPAQAVAGHTMTLKYQDGILKTYIEATEIDSRRMDLSDLIAVGFRAWYGENTAYSDIVVKRNGETLYNSSTSPSLAEDFPGMTVKEGSVQGSMPASDGCARKAFQPLHPSETVTAFQIEFDLKLIHGNSGFIFSGTDTQNFFMWQLSVVSQSGKSRVLLRPHTWKNGNAQCLDSIDVTDAMAPYLFDQESPDADAPLADRYNRYKLEICNGVITTFVRRLEEPDTGYTFVNTYDFQETISFGKVGFRHNILNGNIYEKAAYRNLDIYDISDPAAPEALMHETFDGMINRFDAGRIEEHQLIFDQNESTLVLQNNNTAEGAVHVRKEFELPDKTIQSARLYITARGGYIPYINGLRVGKDYLNPGNTDYNYRTSYKTYDVTAFLKKADANAIGIVVGKAWFASQNRSIEEETAKGGQYVYPFYGREKAVLAQLEIRYTDQSTKTVIGTDETWLATDQGPFINDDNWDGEIYDARKELGDWTQAGYVPDERWSNAQKALAFYGEINSQMPEPVEEYTTLSVVERTEPSPGVYIYNLGQNMAGVTRITATAPAGTVMKIRHGEMLYEDGTLMTSNLGKNAEATDYYVFKGDPNGETYQPSFTYHGFQYIEISGLDAPIANENVCGVVLSTLDPEHRSGVYETSNALVNKLYQNTMWSQIANSFSIPTDCPQRSERYGWLGDAQVFTRTATYNFDVTRFYHKYTQDLRDGQRDSGAYLDLSPNPMGAFYDNNVGWADAGIIIPWQIYQQYGDPQILEENYDSMKKFIDFLERSYPESEGFNRPKGLWGDWMGPDQPDSAYIGLTFYAYSTRLFAKTCDVLGKEEDAAYYTELADKVHQTWLTNYLTEEGRIDYGTVGEDGLVKGAQTAYAQAIYFELIPEEHLPAAGQYLVKAIEKNDGLLATGFLGTCYIAPALSMTGNAEAAYRLLLQEENPSWLFPVLNGATTIWEQWASFIKEGYHLSNDSFNHYSLGAVVEWMYRYSAGIDRDDSSPGFKHFILQPSPSSQLGEDGTAFAKASYESPYGLIRSEWTLDASNVCRYTATVPANTTATLRLPTSRPERVLESGAAISEDSADIRFIETKNGISTYEIGSGTYHFTFTMDEALDVQISNPQGIKSVAIIGENTYPLPCRVPVSELDRTITVESRDPCYAFSHWTGDICGAIQPLPVDGDGTVALTANFTYLPAASDTKTLYITGDTGGSVIINGEEHTLPFSQNYADATELSIEFIPDAGYVFKGVDGDFTSDAQLHTLQMNGDVTLTPNFVETTLTTNIALHQTVNASSRNTNEEYGWDNKFLTDGVTSGTGYTSNGYSQADVSDSPVWVETDIGRNRIVSKVILYPRTDISGNQPRAIPEDFTIQVRAEGDSDYTVVKTITGHPNNSSDPIVLQLDEGVLARYVRVSATKLGAVEGGYHMQFAEMEVYNAENEPLVEQISLTAPAGEVKVGQIMNITAAVSPKEALNKEITWYVHDRSADGGYAGLSDKAYLNVSGSVATLTALSEGDIVLVARAEDGGGVIATLPITVAPPYTAAEVTALISALPEAAKLTLQDEEAVTIAKRAFDALDDPDEISDLLQKKLSDCCAMLDMLKQPVKRGDMDANGSVSVSDVVILRTVITKAGEIPISVLFAGDINQDGILSVSDVVDLRTMIVKGSA